MVVDSYIPDERDIVWIDLDPQTGHEQKGRRPALVLSPRSYNRTGLFLICPITNQIKGYPFEVLLGTNHLTTGAVLADQIKSLDWTQRRVEFRETADDSLVSMVKDRIALLLQFN
jgi:mRNA interferase MazF